MNTSPLRKQIALTLPLDDWKVVRFEAARRRIPISELCRRWLEPSLKPLRDQRSSTADAPSPSE